MNRFSDCFLFRADFRKDVAHRLRDNVDKFEEERFVKSEGATITHGATQNSTQNVTAAFVRRNDSVRDGEAQRADVISDDAKSDVDPNLGSARFQRAVRGILP